MIKFVIELPDCIYAAEPETWKAYFQSLQEMANRMANSYEKYHSGLTIKESSELGEDKMAFVYQRQAMYQYESSKHSSSVCDCGFVENPSWTGHSPSCFLILHRDKLDSGNTENLIDAANGLVLERMFPDHSKAHFRSQTTTESPGIVLR